jgi:hypothetical protein
VILGLFEVLHVLEGRLHDAPPFRSIVVLTIVIEIQTRERRRSIGIVLLSSDPVPDPEASMEVHPWLKVMIAVGKTGTQIALI